MASTYFELRLRCLEAAVSYYSAHAQYHGQMLNRPFTPSHSPFIEECRIKGEVYLLTINDCLTYLESGNQEETREGELNHLYLIRQSVELVLANFCARL